MPGLRWTHVALAIAVLLLAQTCALAVLEWNAGGALMCTLGLCTLTGVIAHTPRLVAWADAFAPIESNPSATTDTGAH